MDVVEKRPPVLGDAGLDALLVGVGLLAMSRCEVLGRVSPGRAGWRSLAVVALEREMTTRLPFRRTSWPA